MTPRQQVRQRSLQSLSHPISIAAIVLLLVNDHWLRWRYPSWWSGKIGDCAWLIFAPFLLAFCLSYVWPKRKIHLVGTAAFWGTGVVFALGNSVPVFHQLIVGLFQQIAGRQPLMVLDQTDLLTLPALLIGWKIWQNSFQHVRNKSTPLKKRTLGWLLLSLGALGTMANTPTLPDYGVECVAQKGQTILAVTSGRAGWFESRDGGLTWTQSIDYKPFSDSPCEREAVPLVILDPNNSDHLWRIKDPAVLIEQSQDGGNRWQTVYEFPAGKQVRQFFYQPLPNFLYSVENRPGGPHSGMVEPETGNLIVSMGFEGVIVVTPTGKVNRVAVGPYSFVDIRELKITEMLGTEMFLALILSFLVISIASVPLWTDWPRRTVFLAFLALGAGIWLVYTLFFRDVEILTLISIFVGIRPISFVILLFYALLAGLSIRKIRERYSWQFITRLVAVSAVTGLLYFIPLVFWVRGLVASYQLVINLAVVFALLPIGYSYDLVKKSQLDSQQN